MTAKASTSIFRIDRFAVPPAALVDFLARLRTINQALGDMPGCGEHRVLAQPTAAAEFNVMTIVEWANEQAMANAKARIQARHAQEGFDPQAFMRTLGVRADFGQYAHA